MGSPTTQEHYFVFMVPQSQCDTEFTESGESLSVSLLNHCVILTIETLPSAIFPGTLPFINLRLPIHFSQFSLLQSNFVEVFHRAGSSQIRLDMTQ